MYAYIVFGKKRMRLKIKHQSETKRGSRMLRLRQLCVSQRLTKKQKMGDSKILRPRLVKVT